MSGSFSVPFITAVYVGVVTSKACVCFRVAAAQRQRHGTCVSKVTMHSIGTIVCVDSSAVNAAVYWVS